MTPRVEMKAMELLDAGLKFNKYYLAGIAHCDQRTAQRILTKLHSKKEIRVHDWCKIYTKWIPIYIKKGKGRADKPYPEPKTHAEICRAYDANPEHKIDKLMRDRARRTIKRIGI